MNSSLIPNWLGQPQNGLKKWVDRVIGPGFATVDGYFPPETV